MLEDLRHAKLQRQRRADFVRLQDVAPDGSQQYRSSTLTAKLPATADCHTSLTMLCAPPFEMSGTK